MTNPLRRRKYDKRILGLLAEGRSRAEAAALLGISLTTVQKCLDRLGLTRKRSEPKVRQPRPEKPPDERRVLPDTQKELSGRRYTKRLYEMAPPNVGDRVMVDVTLPPIVPYAEKIVKRECVVEYVSPNGWMTVRTPMGFKVTADWRVLPADEGDQEND
jgi:hypothetical protein